MGLARLGLAPFDAVDLRTAVDAVGRRSTPTELFGAVLDTFRLVSP